MSRLHALPHDLQAALFSAFALVAPADGEQVDERALWGLCAAPSATSSTGRQWAQLVGATIPPGLCYRELLGGEAPAEFPDCEAVGLAIGCSEIDPSRP